MTLPHIFCQDVHIMTQHNYETILESFDYVLVDFFLPWCGPCQKLGPEYAKAASRLKSLNKPIALAQVNAHENPFLVQKYTILEYPTLKFFAVGVELPYKGGDTEDEIYKWMRLRALSSTKLLSSLENLEDMIEINDLLIVFIGQPGEAFQIYEKVTKTYENLNFVHFFEAEEETNNDQVLLIKKGKRFSYTSPKFNFIELRAFINRHQTGVILPLDKYNAYKIFDDGKPGLVLLLDDSQRSDQALEDLRNVLDNEIEFKEKFIAYFGDYNQESPKTFMQLFDIKSEDLPQIRIVNPQKYSKNVDKYEPPNTTNLTPSYIALFCKLFLSGSLKKVLKSQPMPKDDYEKVKVLVGRNFESIVYDEAKDVMVMFYAHWCHHCMQFEPTYRTIADQLSSNPKIVLAKTDATQNEYDNIQITAYPTLKFFQAKSKQNPIDFQGNRDLQSVLDFIMKHTSFPKPATAPQQNSNDPIELSLANFDEIVYRSQRHVLVNFYVTPCGFCKQMDQTYKELIREAKEMGIDVLVTRIDWIKNNIPNLNVRAFPSVWLFLKDGKNKAIEYQGDRSLEDFVRFLKENCPKEEQEEKIEAKEETESENSNEKEREIQKVDQKNFKDMVYDEKIDFVLFLYKKNMKEDNHLRILQRIMKNVQSSVVFGEMDLERNKLPDEISYQIDFKKVPTMIIFIRQYKRSPSQFMGDITNEEEIKKFIIKESSFTLENRSSKTEKGRVRCDQHQCKEEL